MRESGIALLIAIAATAGSPTWVGRFTTAGAPPAPWNMVPLKGEKPTSYRVATVAGRMALEARVDSSMSLMARPINVDLGGKAGALLALVCRRAGREGRHDAEDRG